MGAWIETSTKQNCDAAAQVAPYVGAWIETYYERLRDEPPKSHPTWVRGLKHGALRGRRTHQVAPYVGAWIETITSERRSFNRLVAPYVGAWIETKKSNKLFCPT